MKKISSILFALTLVSSSAAFADASDYGNELIDASKRINSILENQTQTPDLQTSPTSSSSPSPSNDPWHVENDRDAVPMYHSAAIRLGDAGLAFIKFQVLENNSNFAESVLSKTFACARVSAALADLATANYYASLPGPLMNLQAFGPELSEILTAIRTNREPYCN